MKKTIDLKNNRVEFWDERFYQSECGEYYYPSVTRVLDALPKGEHFYTWMKDVGHNASIIAGRAADEGTNVHDALEGIMQGIPASLVDADGKENYNETEWKCIMRGHQFLERYSPKPEYIEVRLASDLYKTGGTADLVAWIPKLKQYWLIDWKTSNNISESYKVQLAIYAAMLEEKLRIRIHNAGILWLKAKTRGQSKTKMPKEPTQNKTESAAEFKVRMSQYKKDYRAWLADKWTRPIQGAGWQFVPVTHKDENGKVYEGREGWRKYMDLWHAVKYIYDFYHKNDKPKNLIYPAKLEI